MLCFEVYEGRKKFIYPDIYFWKISDLNLLDERRSGKIIYNVRITEELNINYKLIF
jgi:hypothetical protein